MPSAVRLVSDLGSAQCSVHPESAALGACTRCGQYYCAACSSTLAGGSLCMVCVERADAVQLQVGASLLGKRDGWVWYLGGLGALGSVYSAIVHLAEGRYIALPLVAAEIVLTVSYFLLLPWARRGLFATLATAPILMYMQPVAKYSGAVYTLMSVGVIVHALFLCTAYRSPRNKLAFRIAIPDDQLRSVAQRLARADAVRACTYGVLSLGVPLLGIASLALSLSALRKHSALDDRVGKNLAIIGLVMSCLSTLGWLFVAALVLKATRG